MKANTYAALLSLALVGAGSAFAQPATTDPVGFVSVTVPAASDAAIGVPIGRTSEYQGMIQSISGPVITVAGTTGWTANQFVYVAGTQPKTYFVRIDSGLKEGLIGTITANDATTLTVTLAGGEDFTNVSTNAVPISPATAGDFISIAPYWTPKSLVSGVLASTQILRYPSATPGTNLAPTDVYFFNGTDSNWYKGTTNVNDVIFQPGEGLTLRNNSTTTAQTISFVGAVPMTAHRFLLRTIAASTTQDQRIFYNSPVPELISTVFPPGALASGDRLLGFDNTALGKNKAAVDNLFWNGSAWFKGTTNVSSTYSLQPGHSYIFRKNQTGASPATVVWSRLQSYLQ